jgi:hypothetical protein
LRANLRGAALSRALEAYSGNAVSTSGVPEFDLFLSVERIKSGIEERLGHVEVDQRPGGQPRLAGIPKGGRVETTPRFHLLEHGPGSVGFDQSKGDRGRRAGATTWSARSEIDGNRRVMRRTPPSGVYASWHGFCCYFHRPPRTFQEKPPP